MTDFKLKRTVAVSPDPSREDYSPGKLQWLEAGTALGDLLESELAQLSPLHFVAEDGSDELPDDWRTNEETLKADRRQEANQAREAKERAKAKAAANKAAAAGADGEG